MARSFEVTVAVDEFYEVEARIPRKIFDQREGDYYTSWENETKTFVSFGEACTWVDKNPKAEILSFVLVTNKMDDLLEWKNG